MYDNRYTGDFPSVEEHNMATLAGILPGRMEPIDDEHRGMSLSVAAVWILSDGILRVVLRVKDEDEQGGALLGYEVLARQMLASFPSTTEEDLAGLFVWEYLAGDMSGDMPGPLNQGRSTGWRVSSTSHDPAPWSRSRRSPGRGHRCRTREEDRACGVWPSSRG